MAELAALFVAALEAFASVGFLYSRMYLGGSRGLGACLGSHRSRRLEYLFLALIIEYITNVFELVISISFLRCPFGESHTKGVDILIELL